MSKHPRSHEISRRRMLALMAGSACSVTQITRPLATSGGAHLHPAAQIATDLKTADTSGLNKHEVDTIAALAEIIIPTDSHSPGAKAAGVDRYITEIVGTSEDTTKKLWTDGLAAVDKIANVACGKDFVRCSAEQQLDLVRNISRNESAPVTLEERFFVAVKQATVEGYYLSDIGIHQELEYQGNAVLAEFPGCTHEKHKGDGKAIRN